MLVATNFDASASHRRYEQLLGALVTRDAHA
jgi:hypothetical protein